MFTVICAKLHYHAHDIRNPTSKVATKNWVGFKWLILIPQHFDKLTFKVKNRDSGSVQMNTMKDKTVKT